MEKCLKRINFWRGEDKLKQYLDGLKMSSERQVLTLKLLKNTLHVQPQHQSLVWGATDILERVSWSNASTLNRKGGIGSSIIKGPRLYNTVFDLTEIL